MAERIITVLELFYIEMTQFFNDRPEERKYEKYIIGAFESMEDAQNYLDKYLDDNYGYVLTRYSVQPNETGDIITVKDVRGGYRSVNKWIFTIKKGDLLPKDEGS